MEASEACWKAAEILAERGLCKGDLEDIAGRVCFEGALRAAITGSPLDLRRSTDFYYAVWDRAACAASKILRNEHGFPEGPVKYNDLESTTQEDVILLLKKVAAELEEGHDCG